MKSYIAPIIITDENGEKAVLYPETKAEAVHGLEELLADLSGASIATTTETTLPNSHDGRLLIVEMIGGEMEQSVSPTLTSQQEIKRTTISAIIAFESGFAVDEWEQGNPIDTDDNRYPSNLRVKNLIKIENGVTYTFLHRKSSGFEFGLNSTNVDSSYPFSDTSNLGVLGNPLGWIAGSSVTFTAIANGYLSIVARKKDKSNLTPTDLADVDTRFGVGYGVAFSQPLELYNKNGNYDIFANGKVKRKYMKKVFNGSEAWSQSSAMPTRFYVDNMKCKAFGLVYCSHAKGLTQEATNADECYLSGSNNGLFVINTNFLTVSAFKDWLSSNPMTVIYELAEETIEELPVETQIALNSIPTYDGITYVEFISDVQPTFYKFKYGTTEMGGMTLESLLTARNNDLRLSALETSVVNNI